jgi:hypothetical protein
VCQGTWKSRDVQIEVLRLRSPLGGAMRALERDDASEPGSRIR